MNLRNIFLLTFAVLLGTSCNKFLDVKPKTQIDGDVAFSDEQGFMDALTGVYLKMGGDAVYGKELSFGLTEVLAKQHTLFNSTYNEYYYAAQYNYTNATVRAKIDAIYNGMYNAIANDNNLISHLNTADKKMFRDVNYSIIRGEAYGLRAMLHFDLLRLFGPAPAAGGNATSSVPYMDQLTVNALPRLKVEEVISRILADCAIAEEALKDVDPVIPGSTTPATTTGYLRDRNLKFNYYAVKALQARVYLYAGDMVKALENARIVINAAGAFPFTTSLAVAAGNHVFTTEHIFGLYKSDITGFKDIYFTPNVTNLLTKTNDAEFKSIYETVDVRFAYITALENTSTNIRYSTKYDQSATVSAVYLNRMPVIRIPEMYYIAAEALKETDPAAAVEYLNIVRRARNLLTDLPATISSDELQNEIFKEYQREFYCEGQLFYYYKRLNLSSIVFANITADNTIYVLPLPDDEIEYGNGN